LIISDDQGWGDYGFMGHPHIQTPALDQLAQESLTFTRGYVAAPLCCPSLASIITGLHPHQHRITSNDPAYDGDPEERWKKGWTEERRTQRQLLMSPILDLPTLPRLLGQRGYLSLQTGKWWCGHFSAAGFTHGMTHGDMDRGGRHGDEGLKIGREGMEPIFDFIDQLQGRPFFLWYAPFLPHTPHNPPERILSKYMDKTDSLRLARYWAMCEWFDETCGQLLDHLEERGLAENTMVLYVCDNGWIQSLDQDNFAPRSKRTPYEGGIRTPIMIRWPGHVQPRMDSERLVSSIDLAPTVLRACELEATSAMQGIDLLDETALSERDTIFGASYTHDVVDRNEPWSSLETRWVIQGPWKLLLHQENIPAELYDLKTDPTEERNLAEEKPDLVQKLSLILDNWYDPR